ncbi:isoprenylcysteine carboxylmethyltransferase family protein [Mesorhizobium sp. DCY119]|uniref:methyltransferase family protein n=1 Tax=Mesorhizobium sp. DCY119 TaxID=2108445 RepID=UPI001FDEEC2C|nr:isoprenylcysteine carboxylmethyltransferase family protein [Mesorhizobium sp. DCY119]
MKTADKRSRLREGIRHNPALLPHFHDMSNRHGLGIDMHPMTAIGLLWLAWLASWVAASAWADRTEKRVGVRAEIRYRMPLVLGTILVFIPSRGHAAVPRFWAPTSAESWACVALVAAGIAFCWWARLHLGRLWSGEVTRKAGHHVVESGPYALVRHPIYTGLLLSIYATMAARGTFWVVAGTIALTLGIWLKARLEERFLREELGSAYDDYARRVPMLVPFMPR